MIFVMDVPSCDGGKRGLDIMRIMGLDFGSKTVGVAVSDPLL